MLEFWTLLLNHKINSNKALSIGEAKDMLLQLGIKEAVAVAIHSLLVPQSKVTFWWETKTTMFQSSKWLIAQWAWETMAVMEDIQPNA